MSSEPNLQEGTKKAKTSTGLESPAGDPPAPHHQPLPAEASGLAGAGAVHAPLHLETVENESAVP